jgi:pimeloyl-ACP methyl ester carboxylesterase
MNKGDFKYWTPSEEDGASIASKLIRGPDDSKLVACLPGLGLDATMFLHFADYFKKYLSILSVSSPGHGYSDPLPSGDYGIDYMVDLFHEYLTSETKTNGNDKISLIGFSLGGLYSIRYAAKHPNEVSSLVLVSIDYTNPYKAKPKTTLKKVKKYIDWKGSSVDNRDKTIDFSEFVGRSEGEIKRMIAKAADKDVMIKMVEGGWDYDGRKDLKTIAEAGIPVLFVYGKGDCFMSNEAIAEATKSFREDQCNVVAVPGKHSFPISDPEVFNLAVEPHLEFLGLN